MPLLRVLLVDDSPADRFLVQEVFAAHKLHVDLTLCDSGAEALDYMHRHQGHRPDVLLLDINMPGMSGLDLLATMKDDAELVHIPVVMLTTSQAQNDVQTAYTLQASSYLVKSSTFSVLLEQVEAFISYWRSNRFCYS